MKQGRPVITFVMAALAVALSIYIGFYVFDTLNDPYATTRAYTYTAYDSAEAYGVLVREEQVLPAQAGIPEVVCSEGEKVAVGQLIARVYRDSQAQSDYAYLEQLDQEIALLQSVVSEGTGVESAARLDEDIIQSMVELRSSAAWNDYSELESQIQDMKGSVLKRGYTYGDGLTTSDLSIRIQQLKEERGAQSQRFAGAANRVTAKQPGIYSSLVDGYESIFTPESILTLTPSVLDQWMQQGGNGQSGSDFGKLITSNRWYFVSNLDAGSAQRLREGGRIAVHFSGDFTQDVMMKVEQISAAEGDRATVILSSDRYLSRTTLLRQQTAQLVFESYEGLRVPKQALHMETTWITDEETGEEVKKSRLGVYALVGGRAEFKEVEVVLEGSDYYVLRAAGTGSRAFRAGDEVIIRAVGLQDGQLLDF